ncbi:MAG: hypothetical protein ABFE13_10365 [Phycisphaerales bacterium]
MRIITTIAMVAVMASMSQAAVTVVTNPANPQHTTAVATYQTTGAMMDGMVVTVNGSDSAIWADTGATSGAASGAEWSLAETGDTFGGYWTLTSRTSITNVMVDAGAGNTMFDILGSDYYTPDSYLGWAFDLVDAGGYNGDIEVTYSGPVSLTSDSFYGDLYRYMNVAFSSAFTGTLQFISDTDNASIQGDINPSVPVPGALVLVGFGSALVRYLRRKQAV